MADPRWLVVIGMIAFYYSIGNLAYNGRRLANIDIMDATDWELQLSHHQGALKGLLGSSLLLLTLVVMVVNQAAPHEFPPLFWWHEGLDAAFVLLAILALVFDGTKSAWHRYFAYAFVALTIPIGITGGILLYQLPM